MQLNESTIKQALKNRKTTAYTMCKDINFSEPSLYRFYKSGCIRPLNEKKIREYLGIINETTLKTQVLVNESSEYWKILYDESQIKIGHLINTIHVLSLGKKRTLNKS